jgi:hypothetical protein
VIARTDIITHVSKKLSMPSDDFLSTQAASTEQLRQLDLSLIQRVTQQDRSALSVLYDRYAQFKFGGRK